MPARRPVQRAENTMRRLRIRLLAVLQPEEIEL